VFLLCICTHLSMYRQIGYLISFHTKFTKLLLDHTQPFRSHFGPGVDSASNRNEYQMYFLGVKAAGAYGWQTYHHPLPLSCNMGTLTSWNPLGHSRPGTGLLYFHLLLDHRARSQSELATFVLRWDIFVHPRHNLRSKCGQAVRIWISLG